MGGKEIWGLVRVEKERGWRGTSIRKMSATERKEVAESEWVTDLDEKEEER